MKITNIFHKQKGQTHILSLIYVAVGIVLFLLIVPAINSGVVISNIEKATDYLTGQGYIVLAAGEYNAISTKLDNLKISADVAVVNAEAAALAANAALNTLLLHNENEVFLYPDSVFVAVNLTAGAPADTFGAWVEIKDSGNVTFSSKFAASGGYIVEITTRNYSVADKIYMIEIATANDGTGVIGRVKVRSDWTYVLALRSVAIDIGDTIYYRMKCETASAWLLADFRYYYN